MGVASNCVPSPAQPPPSPCSGGFAGPPLPSGSWLCSDGGRYKQGSSHVRGEACALVPDCCTSCSDTLALSYKFPQAGRREGLPASGCSPPPEVSLAFSGMVPDPENLPPGFPPRGHTFHQFLCALLSLLSSPPRLCEPQRPECQREGRPAKPSWSVCSSPCLSFLCVK